MSDSNKQLEITPESLQQIVDKYWTDSDLNYFYENWVRPHKNPNTYYVHMSMKKGAQISNMENYIKRHLNEFKIKITNVLNKEINKTIENFVVVNPLNDLDDEYCTTVRFTVCNLD